MRLRRIVAPMIVCSALACGLVPASASAASVNCNPPSSPACPSLVGSVSDANALSGATSIAVSGHYAYTTAYYAGAVTAVDISNPAHPVITGSTAPTATLLNGTNIAIAGGYAYVTSKNRNQSTSLCTPGPPPNCTQPGANDDTTGNALTIVDIHTDPAHPTVVGSIHDSNKLFGAYGIALQGNFAYVAAQGCLSGQPCPDPTVGNQFDVIDVSHPTAPVIVGNYTGPSTLHHADSVAVSGRYAFVTASYSNRFTVMDISNPAAPTPVASIGDPKIVLPNDVAFQGNYAYVADQTGPKGTVTVINISTPTAPKVVGSITDLNLNQAYRIKVRGNFAYVSSSHADTIAMVDVSNPASPTLAAVVHDVSHLHKTTGLDLALTGRYLIASSPLLATETQTDYPPFPLQAGGPSATGTVSVLDMDPSPVSVTLTSPLNGAQYKKGAVVNASYSCAPGGLIPLASCTGPVANGAAIDTGTQGTHTFTVTGIDQDGQTGLVTVTYTVTSSGKPVVSALQQGARVWREHGPKHAKHKPPLGTKFTFALSQSAKVTLSFTQMLPGRKAGGRCVAPTRKNRHHRACKRALGAGSFTVSGHAGTNTVTFRGKLHGRFLKPGIYTLAVTASAGGSTSRPKTITFTIVLR